MTATHMASMAGPPAKLEKLEQQEIQDLAANWLQQAMRVRPRNDKYLNAQVNGRHFDAVFHSFYTREHIDARAQGLYKLQVYAIAEHDAFDAIYLKARNGVEWNIYFTRKQGRPPKALDY